VSGNTSGVCDGSNATLSVAGGILTLSANGGSLTSGSQFFHPAEHGRHLHRHIRFRLGGGQRSGQGYLRRGRQAERGEQRLGGHFSGSDSANLLETVGNLIGYLETNNEDGIGNAWMI